MDRLKFRIKPDPIDEDFDDSLTAPKTLSFDSSDDSETECIRPCVSQMELAVDASLISPVPSKKRKIQTTISPNFLNGLQIEPARKRLTTITNTGSGKRSAAEKKTKAPSTSPFGVIPFAVRKRDNIGDGSKKHRLPTVKGRQADLKCINPDTLAQVLMNEIELNNVQASVIDCRYPYEYSAGHIRGAINIFTLDGLRAHFLSTRENLTECEANILIFHCEFSSERAPELARMLRNEDRIANEARYPALYYPEIYVLNGGYKAFFQSHRNLCDPQVYKPMTAIGHEEEYRLHKKTAKSQGGSSRGGTTVKMAISRR